MVIIFDEYQRYYYISVRPLLNHLKAKFMNEWMNERTFLLELSNEFDVLRHGQFSILTVNMISLFIEIKLIFSNLI